MKMGNSRWHIRSLVLRLLELLLKLYPARFRREFSSEMKDIVLSRVREAEELGWTACLSVVFQEFRGLVPSILQECWHELRFQKERAMVLASHFQKGGYSKTVAYIRWADPPLWFATLANLLPLWLITLAFTAGGVPAFVLAMAAIFVLLWFGWFTPEAATAKLFSELENWPQSGLADASWEHGFRASFNEGFQGDRVQAFMGACLGMIMASYGNKTEFYLLDDIEAQKLYNSARNIETAVWKLSNARQANGRPFLIGNSIEGDVQNLSFEREFAKIIAWQDMLALFIEDRSNRSISRVVQNAASFAFLPI